jgi:hypothetical protein
MPILRITPAGAPGVPGAVVARVITIPAELLR